MTQESVYAPLSELDEWLDRPVPERATSQREGPKGRTLDYVDHHYIQRLLNSKFGHDGWSFEVQSVTPGGEGYICIARMKIGEAVRTEVGEDTTPKMAASDALKRCAMRFGERLGGSLYA